MNDATVFPSKVDRWLMVLVVAGAIVGLAAVLEAWRVGSRDALLANLLILAGAYGFVIWLFACTRYTVTDQSLIVRCGPLRWTIARAEIVSVKPTRNPLSGPALSLDRLEVRYGDNRVIRISPEDKTGFLHALDLEQPAG